MFDSRNIRTGDVAKTRGATSKPLPSGRNTVDHSELASFIDTLFRPLDLIEIRAIETWTDADGKKCSLPTARHWWTTSELLSSCNRLEFLNDRANVFFGVNPRSAARGTKDAIQVCRCLWVDIDNITDEIARERFESLGLAPTVLVNSGHGVHAYFRLRDAVEVANAGDRARFEQIVKTFAESVSGDATQDVTRLLRLPGGLLNVKDLRNGRTPVPCHMVVCEPDRVFDVSQFDRFYRGNTPTDTTVTATATRHSCPTSSSAALGNSVDHRRIRGLLRLLDDDVEDRSRRDFFVVSHLLSLVPPHEIWPLVQGRSKFAGEAGERYFQVTLKNAMHRRIE